MNQQPLPKTSERFRKDFSFAQVLASALSAVTCMFLAPKIGIIGGVLGVAIGAAVAAIASQAYKILLSATKDKLAYQQQQKIMSEPSMPSVASVVDKTTLAHDSMFTRQTASQYHPQAAQLTDTATSKNWIKYLIVICLVTLASVGITAGIIMYTTSGAGLGTKPQIVYIEDDDTSQPAQNTKPQKHENSSHKADHAQNNSGSSAQQDNNQNKAQSAETSNNQDAQQNQSHQSHTEQDGQEDPSNKSNQKEPPASDGSSDSSSNSSSSTS